MAMPSRRFFAIMADSEIEQIILGEEAAMERANPGLQVSHAAAIRTLILRGHRAKKKRKESEED